MENSTPKTLTKWQCSKGCQGTEQNPCTVALHTAEKKSLWRSTWQEKDGKVLSASFKTRKLALAHNGSLLQNGFTVQGVTKVSK